ncbi:phytanoyl-CoA dioxygenase [Aplysia californica]|uniref:Phytanoyl-CoA dioxygenase n=1 Tax=Aplysia californica TaxID=6500 RepID=A0ABM1ADW9_APLCA|nr:phytanoyl-CoA dioxygenase [Aplysia californica]
MSIEAKYPGQGKPAHPELFNLKAMPEQPTELKPGQLPADKIRLFFEKGFLVVEDFFTDTELNPCLTAVEEIVDRVATRIHKAGKLQDLHEDKDVFQRLTYIDKQFPGAAILAHKDGILPDAFQNLWANERLLNLMEQILGPKVCANPIWNVRPKAPDHPDGEIPWHQDSGYFDPASYTSLLPVAWIPLLDVTEENGCLQIIEGGHKTGKVSDHLNCFANTWHVMLDESKMEDTLEISLEKDVRTLPINKGSLILFNNLVPHRSVPNKGKQIRWSLDLRFQRPGEAEGLYGELAPVLLRDRDDPSMTPDWSPYVANRHLQQHQMTAGEEATPLDKLDTTLTGPWMKQWRLVHGNRHTEAAGLVPEGPER